MEENKKNPPPLAKLTKCITVIEVVNNITGKEYKYVKNTFAYGLIFFYSKEKNTEGMLCINGVINDDGSKWAPIARLQGHSIISVTQIDL